GDEVAVPAGEQVLDGVVGAGPQDGALVAGGQEGGVPVLRAVGGVAAVVGQDDEGRQVLVEAAQAVADPAAHAGEAGRLEAGGLEVGRLAVDARLADEVVDEGDVVHAGAQCRDGLAEVFATAAVAPELPGRGEGRP